MNKPSFTKLNEDEYEILCAKDTSFPELIRLVNSFFKQKDVDFQVLSETILKDHCRYIIAVSLRGSKGLK